MSFPPELTDGSAAPHATPALVVLDILLVVLSLNPTYKRSVSHHALGFKHAGVTGEGLIS